MTSYFAIRSEGGLLPLDILERVACEELPGQKARDFGLAKGRRLGNVGTVHSDRLELGCAPTIGSDYC